MIMFAHGLKPIQNWQNSTFMQLIWRGGCFVSFFAIISLILWGMGIDIMVILEIMTLSITNIFVPMVFARMCIVPCKNMACGIMILGIMCFLANFDSSEKRKADA